MALHRRATLEPSRTSLEGQFSDLEAPLIAEHPTDLYLSRLAPGSRRTMRHALDVIAGYLTAGRCAAKDMDWSQIRPENTAELGAMLVERYASSMVNKVMSALRGVLREAWRTGHLAAERYQEMSFAPRFPSPPRSASRSMTTGELRALFCACASDPRPAGVRDTAMLGILYGAGLRRSEVVTLDLSDYTPQRRTLRVRGSKSTRTCFLQRVCVKLLDEWIKLRGAQPGALFHAINRGNNIVRRRLSNQSVYDIMVRRAAECGVAPFPVHSLRRTFIGNLLASGADIGTTQKLAGHLRCTSTARYDSRDAAQIDIAPLLEQRYRTAMPQHSEACSPRTH